MSVLIAVCGFALSVGTFFVGRLTAAKNDGQKDGEMQIDGTLYNLTGEGYVKINGVLCPITSSLVKHG
ncbi:MAG: hypothetical protein J6S41_07640, partial [Clostridia bacterium]|nr:hypothetical protein [Clostridia bacterium]